MQLYEKELRPLIHNCLEAKFGNDGSFILKRLTDEQYEIYKRKSPVHVHVGANVCECIDFMYTGKKISFDYKIISRGNHDRYSFDIEVNKKLFFHYASIAENLENALVHHIECNGPGEGERRVTVFLPCSAGVCISNFMLDNGASVKPYVRTNNKKILMFGDSITQGFDCEFTSLCYATRVAHYFDAEVLNQAVAGYFFDADVVDTGIDFAPDVITIALGTNDWGKHASDFDGFVKAAADCIEKIANGYPEAKIYGILPIWRNDKYIRPERFPYDKIYGVLKDEYSKYKNVSIIDGRYAVPNMKDFYSDGLHPNVCGSGFYAQYVTAILERDGVMR